MVAQWLLRTPNPPAASILRPTGSVPEVNLVPPTKTAEDRITSVVVKTKLHILACDHPWGYDTIASSSANNTDQATSTIPHSLDANVAAALAESFRTISVSAGTPVDAIAHDDHFAITTLPAFTGPDVHVYSVEDGIVDTNAETGTAVGVEGVPMDVVLAEANDATPTNLHRVIESGNHHPAIVRWSRSQPPGSDPLPWAADATPIPATTLAPGWPGPGGDTHAIAVASTTQPTARSEGLNHTIARVNAMEGALAAIAQAQAQTSASIVQLTSSVAALVQHVGIPNAPPPSAPPAAPVRKYAAIASAPVPAVGAVVATGDGVAMEVAAAGAGAAAGPSWLLARPDHASGRGRVDAHGCTPVRGD